MLKVLESLSKAGEEKNEDLVWHDGNLLAVLDGSSGLIPMALDALWFTNCFVEGLAKSAAGPLFERINYALDYSRNRFFDLQPGYDAIDYPSAAGAFVQERSGAIEVLAVGDCTACLTLEGGREMTFSDDTIRHLDDEVIELCEQIRDTSGRPLSELMKEDVIRQRLLENRHKMNRSDGYRILSMNMEPLKASDMEVIPAEQVRKIVLFSDGFEEMADQLRQCSSSLEDLYSELRNREAKDPTFEMMPRFKSSDDASALIAEVA